MKLNRSTKIAMALLILGILWMLSGIFARNDEVPAGIPGDKAIQVTVETSQASLYDNALTLRGRSKPSREVRIRSEIEGPVNDVVAERGNFIEMGDLIVTIDKQDRQARLAQERARLEEARIKQEAAKELFQRGFRSATQLAESQAVFEQAQATLATAQLAMDKTRILAPFDGVLSERFVEKGDYLKAGDDIAHLVDLDPLYILGEVSETEVSRLVSGMEGTATTVTGRTRAGYIHYISPTANEVTRTYKIELQIPNPGYEIPSGLTTDIRIPLEPTMAHRISPAILTLTDDGLVGVKAVDRENRVAFYPVKILADLKDGMWVSGLPERADLIVLGQEYVKAGETVIPVHRKERVINAQPDQRGS